MLSLLTCFSIKLPVKLEKCDFGKDIIPVFSVSTIESVGEKNADVRATNKVSVL